MLCVLKRRSGSLVRENSGSVEDCLARDRGFEPHPRHCVVSLSKTHLSMLSTGSTQQDITEKLLNGMLRIKSNKQVSLVSDG